MVNRVVLVALMAAAPLIAAAQAPAAQQEAAAPRAAPSVSGRRDTVRLFIVHKMRENLDLSDAQTLNVLDVLEAIDLERESEGRARRVLLSRMQGLLADPATSEAAFKEAAAQFQKSQEQNDARMRDLEARLLSILSPKQQVQFVILRRQLLEEVVQEGFRGRAGRVPGRFRQ
jgi:Spy/CpxP family protein refolding chaperone